MPDSQSSMSMLRLYFKIKTNSSNYYPPPIKKFTVTAELHGNSERIISSIHLILLIEGDRSQDVKGLKN